MCVAETRATRPNGEWGYILAANAGPRVPIGGVTLKRRCTYQPSVIYLIVNKLLSLSLSLSYSLCATPALVNSLLNSLVSSLLAVDVCVCVCVLRVCVCVCLRVRVRREGRDRRGEASFVARPRTEGLKERTNKRSWWRVSRHLLIHLALRSTAGRGGSGRARRLTRLAFGDAAQRLGLELVARERALLFVVALLHAVIFVAFSQKCLENQCTCMFAT